MDSSLPIVSFGKYKGKPITELLTDASYLQWCKQQDFLKQKDPVIYNIIVNQTISSNTLPSNTPEHNKMQNLFLKKSFQLTFINKLFGLDINKRKLEALYASEQYQIYFGNQKFLDELETYTIRSEFEAIFNWDVCLKLQSKRNTIHMLEEHYKSFLRENQFLSHNKEHIPPVIKNLFKEIDEATIWGSEKELSVNLNRYLSAIYIEIKPLVGDDYPCVLRKMKAQKKLLQSTTHLNDSLIFCTVLLIDEFASSSTTKDELIDVFSQSNIRVLFLKELESNQQHTIDVLKDQLNIARKRVSDIEHQIANFTV